MVRGAENLTPFQRVGRQTLQSMQVEHRSVSNQALLLAHCWPGIQKSGYFVQALKMVRASNPLCEARIGDRVPEPFLQLDDLIYF